MYLHARKWKLRSDVDGLTHTKQLLLFCIVYITVTELWRVQDYFYDFQSDITQKLRKGEQILLCVTLCFDLIYISIKYHEDILKIVYRRTDEQRYAIIRPYKKSWIPSARQRFTWRFTGGPLVACWVVTGALWNIHKPMLHVYCLLVKTKMLPWRLANVYSFKGNGLSWH